VATYNNSPPLRPERPAQLPSRLGNWCKQYTMQQASRLHTQPCMTSACATPKFTSVSNRHPNTYQESWQQRRTYQANIRKLIVHLEMPWPPRRPRSRFRVANKGAAVTAGMASAGFPRPLFALVVAILSATAALMSLPNDRM
jgi:hypothetical protein